LKTCPKSNGNPITDPLRRLAGYCQNLAPDVRLGLCDPVAGCADDLPGIDQLCAGCAGGAAVDGAA
jgi:hypothetical protein